MKLSLVPSKKMTFHTHLSQQEVMRRIRAQLDSAENAGALHRFEGEVGDATFRIWERFRPRKNSFIPIVEGEVLKDGTETLIRIVMRMSGCVWIFVLVWCYPFALILFLATTRIFREGIGPIDKDAIFSIAFVIGMPAVMITITKLGFRDGIRTAKAFLTETLVEIRDERSGMRNDG